MRTYYVTLSKEEETPFCIAVEQIQIIKLGFGFLITALIPLHFRTD
jgi:hypothetical protein